MHGWLFWAGRRSVQDTFPMSSLDDDRCPAQTKRLLHVKGVLLVLESVVRFSTSSHFSVVPRVCPTWKRGEFCM